MNERLKYFVPAVLAVSFAVRAAYILHTGNALIYPDEEFYHGLALKLASADSWGGLFHSREPLYPVIIWLTYKVTGAFPLAVKLLQAGFSTVSAWLIYRTAASLFGNGAGRAALLIAALYPFTIFYDARLLRESTLVLLGFGSLYFALKPGGRPLNILSASALAGLAVTAKTVFLFYWLPFLIAALFIRRIKPGTALLGAAAFMLAISPLLAYNRHHTGKAFLTRGQMFNLYIPLVIPPEVIGTSRENAVIAQNPVCRTGLALPEGERDDYFKKHIKEEIFQRPLNFAKRTAWRFFKLWRPFPYGGRDYSAGSWGILVAVSLLSDGWIIPVALLALFLLRRRIVELWPAYIYVASLTVIYSLSWSQMRYRLPMMPVLILLASPLLARAAEKLWPGPFWKDHA